MTDLQERLAAINLPDVVVVQAKFAAAVTNREGLEAAGAPYGEAQAIKRVLCRGLTHKESKERIRAVGKAFMGLVDPYYLCQEKVWAQDLTPEDKLKLYSLLGRLAESVGESVVTVVTAVALAPRIPAPSERWFDKYRAWWNADDRFWKAKRKQYPKKAQEIRVLGEKHMAGKYHRTEGCNVPMTEEFFYVEQGQEWAAPNYWNGHRAEIGL